MTQFNAVYTTQLDIVNRTADHLGQDHLLANTWPLTDPGKLAMIFNSNYDKLRQAELRRNIWRFATRRATLRPVDLTTRVLVPAVWAAGTYKYGAIVSHLGYYWQTNSVTTDEPGVTVGGSWVNYFGSMDVSEYDSTTSYHPGELVYVSAGDGTYKVFVALQTTTGSAGDEPSTSEAWDATVTYNIGDTVIVAAQNYVSIVDLNLNNAPASSASQWATTSTAASLQWQRLTSAVLSFQPFVYPIGSGPASQTFTRNVYRLPYGFLRQAPEDPKAGSVSILGSPSQVMYRDYDFEGNFIVTRTSTPIVLRFVADVRGIENFDSMFCEGLAARIALETCESVTQSTERMKNIAGQYAQFMREARLVNGIETGAVQPPVDDWISCRL